MGEQCQAVHGTITKALQQEHECNEMPTKVCINT
jgi:hypothetical protein